MNHDDPRDTRELQQDISQTRSHLDKTLDAIEERLAPRQLIDDGIDYLRHNGAREYVTNLGRAAKNDPLPLALVGVGLAWLMLSDGRHRSDTSQAYTLGSAVEGESGSLGDKMASARGKVSDLGHQVSASTRGAVQRLSDTAASAKQHAQRVGEVTQHGRERVRGAYDYLIHEQPLALGAIGLAVGVLLAASAPRTRQEDELLGSASDRLKGEAKAAGREQLDKVKVAAASAIDTADDELSASSGGDANRAQPGPGHKSADGSADFSGSDGAGATGASHSSRPSSVR